MAEVLGNCTRQDRLLLSSSYPGPTPLVQCLAVGDVEERDTYTDGDWEAFVAEINESMDAFDLEFRRIVDEQAGSRLCTIVREIVFEILAES